VAEIALTFKICKGAFAMKTPIRSRALTPLTLFVALLAAGAASNSLAYSYSDDFDDGTIDNAFWGTTGDGISESGGVLNLARNFRDDSIFSNESFSGKFDISFDILAKSIVTDDQLHGITLADDSKQGVSFGFYDFSKSGTFYSAERQGVVTRFYYSDDTYSQDTWYSFRLSGETGGTVGLYVDDNLVFTRDFSSVSSFSVALPGYYSDGNGTGVWGGGQSVSMVDNFKLSVSPVPEPSQAALLVAGLFGLGLVARRRRSMTAPYASAAPRG
jgi:hypothetical protein